ncbi:hypothetical protein Godav_029565 [Gossypium davidsonii]|uniref:RNase H type-1 domain-containing protein n=1 Tax=Gossypium davidsonii TaxID=34287 RepID=A0A7J8T7Q2_GOSDV|nr:hypothetical protein [Gossypium davidsonii]
MWKVYNDFLPTYANPNKRNLLNPSACLKCLEGTESVDHLLRFRPVTEQKPIGDDGIKQSIQDISGFIAGYIKELESISDERPSICMPKTSYWRPPQQGTVKFNFSSSFNVHGNKSFLGLIIRNKVCLIMGACTYPYSHVVDAFVAEARACERVIWFARELRFQHIQIEGDSLAIIKKLQLDTSDKSVLGSIVVDIKQNMGLFVYVTFHHVSRDENEAAHVLAREGCCSLKEWFWIEEAPELAERAAVAD